MSRCRGAKNGALDFLINHFIYQDFKLHEQLFIASNCHGSIGKAVKALLLPGRHFIVLVDGIPEDIGVEIPVFFFLVGDGVR